MASIEVKWSDRFVSRPEDLSGLLAFCQTNGIRRATVTTRTVLTTAEVRGITIDFVPSALYCYTAGQRRLARPDAGPTRTFALS